MLLFPNARGDFGASQDDSIKAISGTTDIVLPTHHGTCLASTPMLMAGAAVAALVAAAILCYIRVLHIRLHHNLEINEANLQEGRQHKRNAGSLHALAYAIETVKAGSHCVGNSKKV